MTTTIVLIAALFAASPSMLFAQTVQPAERQTQAVPTEQQTQTVQPTEHQRGIIDAELQEADSIIAQSCAKTFATTKSCFRSARP